MPCTRTCMTVYAKTFDLGYLNLSSQATPITGHKILLSVLKPPPVSYNVNGTVVGHLRDYPPSMGNLYSKQTWQRMVVHA